MSRPQEGSLIYSFVARGTVVLAEYTQFAGNFPDIATECLQRLPSGSSRFTYTCNRHTFNFLVADGYAYCVVATESAGKQIPIAFLERLKEEFKKRYGGGKADTAVAKSLSREFGPVMKEQMKDTMDHAEEIDQMMKVKAQVAQVKNVMLNNIDQAMDRGVKLTILEDKAENLHEEAQKFKTRGGEIRRKMWYQNMKIKLAVFGIVLLLVLIIWLSICKGFDCSN
ncbi:vesicle-associated membrane protein 724-like [Rhodamnia argentea]|uniref:Vesicle-associated membrane protein 724-like n=1 Tax=Rhodamnia argentea TaxID=178133 RepID=A0A8B8N7D5_9MYRT|nr:vesicle-associated membrane protein 724-like [Rhodamnia argentea]